MPLIPDDIFNNARNFAEIAKKMSQEFLLANQLIATQAKQMQKTVEVINASLAPVLDHVRQTAKWLQELDRAGLTPNLGPNRSHRKIRDYQKLLRMGYAIFWVPRYEIIDQLLEAQGVKSRRVIITDNKSIIMDDCEEALALIDKKYLQDYRYHLESAIHSMKAGEFRSAQSTATICFDALFDQIIDETSMAHFGQVLPAVTNTSKTLRRKLSKVPAKFIYASLQSLLVIRTIRKFDRLNPKKVSITYGRHSSTHSVSARQFNEHNALQAILITTSILATTDKLGRHWMTNLSKYL
jgi:hypothetical protein